MTAKWDYDANAKPTAIPAKKPSKWWLIPITVLIASPFLAYALYDAPQEVIEEPPEIPPDAPDEPDDSFSVGMNVITLNQTGRADIVEPRCTIYFFEGYENFTDLRLTYGAALGLLIFNCSGPNETVTLSTGDGQYIESFVYRGQSLIALCSWTMESYYANGSVFSESWGGMENASRAWCDGTWNPTVGIVIEHNDSIVLGDAQLDILCVVPIPEFSDVVIPVLIVIAVFLLRRRKT